MSLEIDRNEVAKALYQHSTQLIFTTDEAPDLQKIVKSIQSLYVALEYVSIPSIESLIRKRLACILLEYTEEYAEVAFQFEQANLLYQTVDDFKLDLLDKIAHFYCLHQHNIDMSRNALDLACSLAYKGQLFDWVVHFEYRRILLLSENCNFSGCFKSIENFELLLKNDKLVGFPKNDIELLLNIIKCGIIFESSMHEEMLEDLLLIMEKQLVKCDNNTQFVKYCNLVNIQKLLLDGNIAECINRKIIYFEKDTSIDYVLPYEFVDLLNEESPLLFEGFSLWISAHECPVNHLDYLKRFKKCIYINYLKTNSPTKRLFYYDLLIFSSLLSSDDSDFNLLFKLCIKKHRKRKLDFVICKYALSLQSKKKNNEAYQFFLLAKSINKQPNALHTFIDCRLCLLSFVDKNIQCDISLINTMQYKSFALIQLFLGGIRYYLDNVDYKSKNNFFESLKLAKNQFKNTFFICASLIGLGWICITSDLEQAYKVLQSAYSLSERFNSTELRCIIIGLIQQSLRHNHKKTEILQKYIE